MRSLNIHGHVCKAGPNWQRWFCRRLKLRTIEDVALFYSGSIVSRSHSVWKQQASLEQLTPNIEQWYQSAPGQSLLGYEQQFIDRAVSACFGYNLLQLSPVRGLDLATSCRVQKKIHCHPLVADSGVELQCHGDQLPIAADTVDVVILHHAHEFAANPHQVLREIHRVLVPRGQLIICGFNPLSLLGAYSLIARFKGDSIWNYHRLSHLRLMDWLNLLDFHVSESKHAFHRLPLTRLQSLNNLAAQRSAWLRHVPFGGAYMIAAQKQLLTMTPTKLKWSRRHALGLSALESGAASRISRRQKPSRNEEVV